MEKINTIVIGAGVGGLGTACWLKHFGVDFTVFDPAGELALNLHNGVHYLHSAPELPFEFKLKKITLTDGVLENGQIYHKPTLNHSLEYSEKVREIQHPSSIMDVGKTDHVWMPKENTLNALLEEMHSFSGKKNYRWKHWLKAIDCESRIATFATESGDIQIEYSSLVSTVPLDKMLPMVKCTVAPLLESNPVYITNYEVDRIVPNWMINIYVPALNNPIYRASFLNKICSIESIRELTEDEMKNLVKESLKMFYVKTETGHKYTWKTGKVMSISTDDREQIVNQLKEFGIYPLGRFGVWNRKLLVDSTINQGRSIALHINSPDWSKCLNSLV